MTHDQGGADVETREGDLHPKTPEPAMELEIKGGDGQEGLFGPIPDDPHLAPKIEFYKQAIWAGMDFLIGATETAQALVRGELPADFRPEGAEVEFREGFELPPEPETSGLADQRRQQLERVAAALRNNEDPRSLLGYPPPQGRVARLKYQVEWRRRRREIRAEAQAWVETERDRLERETLQRRKEYQAAVDAAARAYLAEMIGSWEAETEAELEENGRMSIATPAGFFRPQSPSLKIRSLGPSFVSHYQRYQTSLERYRDLRTRRWRTGLGLDSLAEAAGSGGYLSEELEETISRVREWVDNTAEDLTQTCRREAVVSGLIAAVYQARLLEAALMVDVSNMIAVSPDGNPFWAPPTAHQPKAIIAPTYKTNQAGVFPVPTREHLSRLGLSLGILEEVTGTLTGSELVGDQDFIDSLRALIRSSRRWLPVVAEHRLELLETLSQPQSEVKVYPDLRAALEVYPGLAEALESNDFSEDPVARRVADEVDHQLRGLYFTKEWRPVFSSPPEVRAVGYGRGGQGQNLVVVEFQNPEAELSGLILINPQKSQAYFPRSNLFSVRDVILIDSSGQAVRSRDILPPRTEQVFNASARMNQELGYPWIEVTQRRRSTAGVFSRDGNSDPEMLTEAVKAADRREKYIPGQSGHMFFVVFGDLSGLERLVAYCHEIFHEWESLMIGSVPQERVFDVGSVSPGRKEMERETSVLTLKFIDWLQSGGFVFKPGFRDAAQSFLRQCLEGYGVDFEKTPE